MVDKRTFKLRRGQKGTEKRISLLNFRYWNIKPLETELFFFLILAHPVYKM